MKIGWCQVTREEVATMLCNKCKRKSFCLVRQITIELNEKFKEDNDFRAITKCQKRRT